MDGQVDHLLVGQLPVPLLPHIGRDGHGAAVVGLAVAGNELPEQHIVFVRGVGHLAALKQPLGKVPQMHHEPAEGQRIPVKRPAVVALHHINDPFNEPGDVHHLAHFGVQFGVDDVQCQKGRLALRQFHAQPLPNLAQALPSQTVLRRVVAHHRAAQRVLKGDALLLAADGKADVVRHGDEQRFIQRLVQLLPDEGNQLLGEGQMLQRDLLHQLPQPPLTAAVHHAVDLLHKAFVHTLAGAPLVAQPAPGGDELRAVLVHRADDIVVDDFFDPQLPRPHKKINHLCRDLSHAYPKQSWFSPHYR